MVSIISFIIVLGVLVFVHEFGHFIVARLCGVGVEKFSIGFGPRLYGWKRGRTDYMVSGIPLGGYVKMVGEEPDSDLDEDDIPYSFTHKKVWQRSLIVAAGPVFNFLLAIVLYFFLYWIHGTYFYPPVVGEIGPETAAFKSGLMVGDEILYAGDKKIESWSQFEKRVKKSDGKEFLLKIKRGEDEKEIIFIPEKTETETLFGENKKEFLSGASPYFPPVIDFVSEKSPASGAGLKPGDRIVKINQEPVDTWNDVSRLISGAADSVTILISRDNDIYTMELTPELKESKNLLGKKVKRKIIGIGGQNTTIVKRLGPVGAFNESIGQTWKVVELTFLSIYKMLDGTISSDNLGGPIMIAQMAGEQARMGITELLAFMALISINLGLLNLLPVPVLDGGHLFFFLIEGITGRPVNIKGREIAQQIGLVLLLLLMVFAFYNDIVRVISG